MNRGQRSRPGRLAPTGNDSEGKVKVYRPKNGSEVEEVLAPRSRRSWHRPDKPMTNRCCYFSPDRKDFGQFAELIRPTDQYQNILREQYGFDPILPDTINQLKELKKVLCPGAAKVESGSQYVTPDEITQFVETIEGTWQNIDNADDIDKYINDEREAKPDSNIDLPQNIHISEVPQIKIIAEKYSKYKKNNMELRKLDEKVVCIEYDIYQQSSQGDLTKLVQKMRAFFSIKPTVNNNIIVGGDDSPQISIIPSDMKNKFKISDDDLKKLNQKEIEIIDGKIDENRPYLDDLKRILKRKQVIHAKKNKTSLDLNSLYEMARKGSPPLSEDYSNPNLLSKAELQEIKDLILKECASSMHGISKRTVKCEKENGDRIREIDINIISQSIVAELLRDEV